MEHELIGTRALVGPLSPSSGIADGRPVLNQRYTREQAILVSRHGGEYVEANSRGQMFCASVVGVTIPVVASNLVSVASLVNPAGSGKVFEITSADVCNVLATTVVTAVGLYVGPAQGATLTTPGTVLSAAPGSPFPPGVGAFYSAATHVGTPTLVGVVGGYGAVTDQLGIRHRDFYGALMLFPGQILSFANSTAASTVSGMMAALTWLERPL